MSASRRVRLRKLLLTMSWMRTAGWRVQKDSTAGINNPCASVSVVVSRISPPSS